MMGTVSMWLAGGVALLSAGPFFEPVTLEVRTLGGGEGGQVAQALVVDTDSDWSVAAIVIQLDAGAMVQDQTVVPGDGTEACDLRFPATASATGPEGFGQAVQAAGACDDKLGGEALELSDRRMDVCWYNFTPGDVGEGWIAKVTFSGDAAGRWTLAVKQGGDKTRYLFTGTIQSGRMVADE